MKHSRKAVCILIAAMVLFGLMPLRNVLAERGKVNHSNILRAVYTPKPPTINGNLMDKCWKEATVARPFYLLGKETPAPKGTTAYVLYDQEYLYVAFKCMEPDMTKLVIKDSSRFNLCDDHVEIFISPFDDKEKFFQISINTAGKIRQSYLTGSRSKGNLRHDETWNSGIKVATFTEANHYVIEAAIPIFSFAKYKFASDWGISFSRDSINPYFNSSWSKNLKAGHQEPENFGILKGIGKGIPEKVIEVSDFDIGNIDLLTSALKFKIINLSDSDRNLAAFFTVKDEQGKIITNIKKEFGLKKGKTETIEIPYKITKRGKSTYRLDIDEPAERLSLWSTGNVFIKIADEAEIFLTDPHYKDTIFEKYPPKAVIGSVKLNVPLSEMLDTTVNLSLKNPSSKEVFSEQFKISNTIKFEIGIERFKEFGKYVITVNTSKKDKSLIKGEKTIKYLPSVKGETFLDKQGFLVVDGKRFFSIGFYGLHWAIDKGWLKPGETYGFNTTVVSDAAGSSLQGSIDKYAAYNLKWIPSIAPFYQSVHDGNWDKLRKTLAETDLKNPNLRGWSIADEPLGRGTPIENLKKGYEIISEIDPYHPVTFVDNWETNTRVTFDAVDLCLWIFIRFLVERHLCKCTMSLLRLQNIRTQNL